MEASKILVLFPSPSPNFGTCNLLPLACVLLLHARRPLLEPLPHLAGCALLSLFVIQENEKVGIDSYVLLFPEKSGNDADSKQFDTSYSSKDR